MKKRIKYSIIIVILLILIISSIDIFQKAKKKKEDQLAFEKDKIASKEAYHIRRNNNKYIIKSSKLEDKTLQNIDYDNTSVYLYYDNKEKATLLKYNIEENKVVVIKEDSADSHGGMQKIGAYYKIGNSIYDSKFKKIKDYPTLEENELLFPNLKETLKKTENGVVIKDLETKEEKELIKNEEGKIYSPYHIKNDGKYLLLNKEEENKKSIVALDRAGKVLNTFDYDQENRIKSFLLLDDVPYLLETSEKEEKKAYKIYNTQNMDLTYKSPKLLTNYLFDDTKLICNDQDGNLKLMDYVTKEEKILMPKKKKTPVANQFILASDGYSLLVTLKDQNNEFYIFYL